MVPHLPYHKKECCKDLAALSALEAKLFQDGAFDLPIASLNIINKRVIVVHAANTHMWPMGTHYWTRDNSLIADRLCHCETFDLKQTKKNRQLGMTLLLSNLTIASSPSQRSRMKKIITSKSNTFVNDALNWPQIFLSIKDNLEGKNIEHWAHKQDAWQMLAYIVLDKLEKGTLLLSQLNSDHKEFLSLIFPFLLRVQYFKQSNSGSWEEIEAVRSSVVAWDLSVLSKISSLLQWKKFEFLATGFIKHRKQLKKFAVDSTLSECLEHLMQKGALHLKRTIPYESPLYSKKDPRHREADSTLIYLLQLETPKLVANILNLPDSWIEKSEAALLQSIETLFDPRSGGHRRYSGDSYQRLGFFRDDISAQLSEMYGAPSGDVSKHFTARDKIVPKGPEAAWTHFTWQLSAWAGRRYQQSLNTKYLSLQKRFFAEGLRTMTRRGMKSIEQMPSGKMHQIAIPANRFPECYLTEEDKSGKQYLFPTPHTPLNWATAEALSAFSAMRRTLSL